MCVFVLVCFARAVFVPYDIYKLHSGQENRCYSCYTYIVHYNNIGSMADFLLECSVFLVLFAFRTVYKAFCGLFVGFIGNIEQFL